MAPVIAASFAPPSGENLSVTLPSWTCDPGWSSARRTFVAFT